MPDPVPSHNADALSRLIEVAGLHARLDLRCQFGGGYGVDHELAAEGDLPFHLVLQGHCRIVLAGGETVAMGPGDFVALPRGAAHRLESLSAPATAQNFRMQIDGVLPLRTNTEEEGAVELDLLCGRLKSDAKAADALFTALPGVLRASLADSSAAAQIGPIVALIRQEIDAQRPGVLALVTALFTALFTLALRAHVEGDQVQPGVTRLASDPRLARAAQAVLADPGQDWPLDALADLSAMSRATFMRRFTQLAGMTPGDFITLVRLAHAAKLLRQTRRSTADIGQAVGYQSEAAFHKAFAKAMGASPAAFRRGAPETASAQQGASNI